jgi:S-methylmethionine-dependent homocysteine/selenocysteine methylase
MGWVLNSVDPDRVGGSFLLRDGSALEKAFDTFEDLRGCARGMYNCTKLAAVPHAMSKPASELLHFAYTIGQVGSINSPIVANK